jgi:hypothetical protein
MTFKDSSPIHPIIWIALSAVGKRWPAQLYAALLSNVSCWTEHPDGRYVGIVGWDGHPTSVNRKRMIEWSRLSDSQVRWWFPKLVKAGLVFRRSNSHGQVIGIPLCKCWRNVPERGVTWTRFRDFFEPEAWLELAWWQQVLSPLKPAVGTVGRWQQVLSALILETKGKYNTSSTKRTQAAVAEAGAPSRGGRPLVEPKREEPVEVPVPVSAGSIPDSDWGGYDDSELPF